MDANSKIEQRIQHKIITDDCWARIFGYLCALELVVVRRCCRQFNSIILMHSPSLSKQVEPFLGQLVFGTLNIRLNIHSLRDKGAIDHFICTLRIDHHNQRLLRTADKLPTIVYESIAAKISGRAYDNCLRISWPRLAANPKIRAIRTEIIWNPEKELFREQLGDEMVDHLRTELANILQRIRHCWTDYLVKLDSVDSLKNFAPFLDNAYFFSLMPIQDSSIVQYVRSEMNKQNHESILQKVPIQLYGPNIWENNEFISKLIYWYNDSSKMTETIASEENQRLLVIFPLKQLEKELQSFVQKFILEKYVEAEDKTSFRLLLVNKMEHDNSLVDILNEQLAADNNTSILPPNLLVKDQFIEEHCHAGFKGKMRHLCHWYKANTGEHLWYSIGPRPIRNGIYHMFERGLKRFRPNPDKCNAVGSPDPDSSADADDVKKKEC